MIYYESIATFRPWSKNELQSSTLHTHTSELFSLYRFRIEGSHWKLSVFWVLPAQVLEICPRCLAQPQRLQGSSALLSPCACSVTQHLECWYTCWCGPVVQAHCEEFCWLFCKAFDKRLSFYTSPATVSCVCWCCKFGPSNCSLLIYTKQQSRLELLPAACAIKFSCTISNCIPIRPVV